MSAKLKGKLSSQQLIEKKQEELIKEKKYLNQVELKQEVAHLKIMKKKAWKLIKESGCDKFSIGDAKISEKHSNFFVNDGNAKTSDVEQLINKVKKEVYKKTRLILN